MSALTVLEPGPLTLVQDRGRPGLARLGVGASGAFDRGAAALANRLVGNPAEAAVLEVLLGGVALRPWAPLWVAVTGARGPASVEPNTATLLGPGQTLRLGPAEHGIRFVVAVRGGVDVDAVLGSRSRDTLAGLGPPPLRAGEVLPIGPEPAGRIPVIDAVPVGAPGDGELSVDVRRGPRLDRFAADAWEALTGTAWTVDARSDRTGIRLSGPPVRPTDRTELPSEGMVPGAIQVSPDGAPTILGPDAPVTGGYPVIAVVADRDLDLLAQVRPGQSIRLRSSSR
ncbi:MAG: biotin-dependent carboxyltransferase family protein [Micrococcales bacterium]|nr:biotin-dependent carboxyltransferase family protein [Micrococcales bacterium]